ncbi:MAG: molybdopterin cofactor-binding domain-containing protein, partial [Pseudomonadota bacterium]
MTGAGGYVDDLVLDDCGAAYALRSPIAHGRFAPPDLSAARGAPGVRAVYAWADVADRLAPLACRMPIEGRGGAPLKPVLQPHLADGKVRHVGQPIAFVVADTLDQARDAAELIEIDYEEDAAVVDGGAALAEGAPILHDAAPGNLAYDWDVGDEAATAAAFAAAAHVVRAEVVNQRVVVAPMEPRGLVIRFDADTGRWEGWVGSQGAHAMRGGIAAALKVEPARLRIHAP